MGTLRKAAVAAVACIGLAACGSGGTPSTDTSSTGTSSTGSVATASKDVTFSADGTTTYGTLETPAHKAGQRLAAALLIAGSGATDRDGNQKPSLTPNTLKQIADALAGQGIMTLRFDKYFAGQTGAGKYTSDPSKIDLNAYLRQAIAGYNFLSGQSTADPRKMLLVGHSEGGLYSILLAENVSPHPAGLALVEPQDERILDLLAVQIVQILDGQVAQGTITADTALRNKRGMEQAIQAFRAGQPVDTSGLLPAVTNALAPLILNSGNAVVARTTDAIDPATYAAKLPSGTRVLVTDGTADFNVPPSTIQPLVSALTSAGITGPGLVSLPGLDHDLNPAGTQPNGAPLDPSFLTALGNWAQPYAS